MEKFLKCPLKIHSGMRFLSFEKEPLDGADKHQNTSVDESSTGIPICNQQIKDKMAVDGNKNLSASTKPLSVVQQSSSITLNTVVFSPSANVTTGKESKNDNFCSLPFAGDLQNELLDATRILEDFLFDGAMQAQGAHPCICLGTPWLCFIIDVKEYLVRFKSLKQNA